MYQLDSRITVSHVGPDGLATVADLVSLMQDCSLLWLESEPAMQDYLERDHVGMMVASRQLDILRRPAYQERVSVQTSVYDYRHGIGYRNTRIVDEQGKTLAISWSIGAFVSLVEGKITDVPQEVIDALTFDPKLDMEYLRNRIRLPKVEPVDAPAFTAMRDDIDFYQHVNNTVYVRMACELLPEDFEPRRLRIEYKLQTKLGEQLAPKLYDARGLEDEDRFVVSLEKDGKPACVVEFSR